MRQVRAIQLRVWAMPWLCEATVRTPRRVPGRTMTANRTASSASLTIISGGSASSPSSTGGHGALDAVLDRHAAGVGPPVADRREHRRVTGAGNELRTLGLGQR